MVSRLQGQLLMSKVKENDANKYCSSTIFIDKASRCIFVVNQILLNVPETAWVKSNSNNLQINTELQLNCIMVITESTNGAKIDSWHSALVNELISQTEKMTSAREMGISPQISSWIGHRIPCMGIKDESAESDWKSREACSQPSEMTQDSNLLMDQHWESVKHRGEWYTTVYDPMRFPFR